MLKSPTHILIHRLRDGVHSVLGPPSLGVCASICLSQIRPSPHCVLFGYSRLPLPRQSLIFGQAVSFLLLSPTLSNVWHTVGVQNIVALIMQFLLWGTHTLHN